MSESLGKIALSSSNESYLGEYEGARTYSEETARLIDNEVKAIIDAQYERVLALLQEKPRHDRHDCRDSDGARNAPRRRLREDHARRAPAAL